MTLPTFYTFRRCPYCMRAHMALLYAGIAFHHREISLADKPADMLALSPKGTVPVLQRATGAVIDESLDIMHWALAQRDPDDWWPADSAVQGEMLALIATNDQSFKSHLDLYKYSDRYSSEAVAHARNKGVDFLIGLDRRLVAQGGYLFADMPKLADIALFPFVRQFANVDKTWFGTLPFQQLHRWLDDCLNSDLFARVMVKV